MTNNSGCGKFIVFEGIDGSGKTTQMKLLAERLRSEGKRVYETAEPTQTVSGGLLRDALSGATPRSSCELAALFLLDRINHNVNRVNGIGKLLGEGYYIICDRYYYSSMAYQGSETDPEWVRNINLSCPEIRRPDVCVFLDLDPETSYARITGSRATTEIYEQKKKLEAVRAAYMQVFAGLPEGENIRMIDASGTIESVAAEIYDAVTSD